jgi:hypothetical protein
LGLCWFHRHRPKFKEVFAPLFSKSGTFLSLDFGQCRWLQRPYKVPFFQFQKKEPTDGRRDKQGTREC